MTVDRLGDPTSRRDANRQQSGREGYGRGTARLGDLAIPLLKQRHKFANTTKLILLVSAGNNRLPRAGKF